MSNELITFEDLSKENGIIYWYASDLQIILDYQTQESFEAVIQRANKALASLKIMPHGNIEPVMNPETGRHDYKLSRFACYMVAMNADSKKAAVAKAQQYFAQMTAAFESLLKDPDQIERLIIRDEIKDGNSSLSSTAKNAGVEDYAKFTNAGYLGMYNMYNFKLAQKRGINQKELLEHMGRTELAANLFRITMTEEKIRNEGINGQINLEIAHKTIGKEIRDVVKNNTGKYPEELPKRRYQIFDVTHC